jgi:hypothetical protein
VTDPSPAGPLTPCEETASRMRAIAAELAAHGLSARVHATRGTLDLTATVHPPGQREAEIVIDEDGYTELRYWNQPGAGPAQVSAVALRVLAALTGPQPAGP